MTFESLALTVDAPLARIELNRPEKRNALSPALLQELVEAAREVDRHDDVKAVVVAGAGQSFCAGADLTAFTGAGGDPRTRADLGRRMAEAITGMRAVTVAAIQGRCVGGGVVLAAACDLRIAASDAVFSIPELDLGIPLAWGGVPRLTRELGPAVAKELIMTCRPFDAEEAHRLRFVNRLAEPEHLDRDATALASDLATRSAVTLRITKAAVDAAAEALVPTDGAKTDADLLASVLTDEESAAVRQRYLEGLAARRNSPARP
jgi:enoyl-CoA hydratase/carnithine racemase